MEKGIDKSAQRALEAYPVEMYEDVGFRCVDKNTYKRQYFIEGYHQAEKDNELTWEDIDIILDITDIIANDDAMEESLKTMSQEEYCNEVLKRFKNIKEL